MLSINQLMKYLRNYHHITVKSNQAQSLRNIGTITDTRDTASFALQISAFLFRLLMKSLL